MPSDVGGFDTLTIDLALESSGAPNYITFPTFVTSVSVAEDPSTPYEAIFNMFGGVLSEKFPNLYVPAGVKVCGFAFGQSSMSQPIYSGSPGHLRAEVKIPNGTTPKQLQWEGFEAVDLTIPPSPSCKVSEVPFASTEDELTPLKSVPSTSIRVEEIDLKDTYTASPDSAPVERVDVVIDSSQSGEVFRTQGISVFALDKDGTLRAPNCSIESGAEDCFDDMGPSVTVGPKRKATVSFKFWPRADSSMAAAIVATYEDGYVTARRP